jgi:aryl-alcohol dehydrogenase-like predicted oxidoreductase
MTVEYRTLGRTGVQVSSICLGAMMFGPWGNDDQADCARIVHRALDAGLNFIDTADVYSAGASEEILGKALDGRRDDVILANKGHHSMGPDANHRGNSRRWLTRAIEASLRRLDTDWIDLYYVHRPDPSCEIGETLSALTTLVEQGKIRMFGCSGFPAAEIVESQWVAERKARERFVCEQPEYSILVRTSEAEILPACERYGMGVVSWSPLAAGWLTGRYGSGKQVPTPRRAMLKPSRFDLSLPHNRRKLVAVDALAGLADEVGLTLIQLALAFVRQHPAITAPIIGPRTIEQLECQIAAFETVLDDAVLDRIDAIVEPGAAINTGEPDWRPPALTDPARRRRRPGRVGVAAWVPPELR